MADIQIKVLDEQKYEVTVVSSTTTKHEVSIKTEYARKLTSNKITTEELIKRTFEFLLKRESNNSILRHFDLSVVAQYFPEYEREISQSR
jgi:uncharacterized protein YifN (PemK superfamily)